MTTPEQRSQTDRWKSKTPLSKLSCHDRKVYRIAGNQLKEGAEELLIAPYIESAGKMVQLLTKRYPDASIGINGEDK